MLKKLYPWCLEFLTSGSYGNLDIVSLYKKKNVQILRDTQFVSMYIIYNNKVKNTIKIYLVYTNCYTNQTHKSNYKML